MSEIDELEALGVDYYGAPKHGENMRGRTQGTKHALERLREVARAKGQKTTVGRADPKRADVGLKKF